MQTLVRNLTETFGPTGTEGQVRAKIQAEIEALADDVRVDALGNLIARKGAGGGKKILLAAHMDEIGLMVKFIDEDGFARFTFLGGVSPLTCIGSRVAFADGTVGVIYYEESKAKELKESKKVPNIELMYVDTGATNRSECPLAVGDPAVFLRPFVQQDDRLIAKALDNRIGCAVLIETLRRLTKTPHEVYFVFTVQEEVSFSGAVTATYGIDPDIALAVDVTGTGDSPNGLFVPVRLGEGPVITVMDKGIIAHPSVKDGLVETAKMFDIPYQLEVCDEGATDAAVMQVAREGVRAGNLSIPTRYIHSPSEIVDLRDVENTIKLLVQYLQS